MLLEFYSFLPSGVSVGSPQPAHILMWNSNQQWATGPKTQCGTITSRGQPSHLILYCAAAYLQVLLRDDYAMHFGFLH